MRILCAGKLVLRDFMLEQLFVVHRHVGFNSLLLIIRDYAATNVGFKKFFC